MAGTDHSSNASDNTLGGVQPVVVLVRPQMGENIGAAARGMWNFGLSAMRLVAPRDGWPNERAVAMASGAAPVLDHVQLSDDTAAACADLNFVYATTARDRDLTKPVLSAEEAALDMRARIGRGEKVGVLFGPERAGLENADVAQANAIISVPVNPAFGSLNLAQCVLLVAYEWLKVQSVQPVEAQQSSAETPANQSEITHLMDNLETRLENAAFFYPPDKAPHMRLNLRNLLSRLTLTSADVRMLQGVIKTLGRDAKGARPRPKNE